MIDIEAIEKNYFYFDEPVPFELKKDKKTIYIYPITVRNSEYFRSSVGILTIDKNSIPDPKIISMSYLQFMCESLFADKELGQAYISAMYNIMHLCLGLKAPAIKWENNRPFIYDLEQGVEISAKEFDSIKRIILYQNFLHYDDTYISPEAKQAMEETAQLKNANIDFPNLERRMAIISSHTGILKKDQIQMTMRAHDALLEEVRGEVDYIGSLNAILIADAFAKDKREHSEWVYRRKRSKFEGYFVSDKDYNKSMGGNGNITQTTTNKATELANKFNNFK